MTSKREEMIPFDRGDRERLFEKKTITNRTFQDIVQSRITRRMTLKGGLGLAAIGFFGPVTGVGCGDDDEGSENNNDNGPDGSAIQTAIGFASIPAAMNDFMTIAEGYEARVLFAFGDPLVSGLDAWRNDGTDDPMTYDRRSGTGHDGMHFFPLRSGSAGTDRNAEYTSGASERGLLVMNHENIFIRRALHDTENGGPTVDGSGNRPVDQVMRELFAHGVSVVEIEKDGAGNFQVVLDSPFNRRIHASTEIEIGGPLRGTDLVRTIFSPTGERTRGTLNNCANGYTPWGTYLTCEENWPEYFVTNEDPQPREKARYGVSPVGDSNYGWETVSGTSDDSIFERFETSPTGATPSDDYRNEPNTYGWIVEVDPYSPGTAPIKRTALGRFRHEGCWPSRALEGEPLAFYSGDDARGEYIYKFVTADNYQRGTSDGSMLDSGTLYVARFNEDGSGDWLELSMNVPALASEFSSLADILVNTRTAADIVGATPMDRPEWGAVNPANGEVYMTLTNSNDSNRPVDGTDAANPRSYDANDDGANDGNRNGHIIRWREAGDRADATSFEWDIFLFGSAAGDRPENLSNLDETNAFASPDGLWFDSRTARGVIWIQTDDSSLREFTNNQMLAAIPGQVGDGGEMMAGSQRTFVGQDAASNQLRRFLTGPSGCEITGVDVTPDGTTMFINIQHPGGEGDRELVNNWPAGDRDATAAPSAVSGLARPRPATVVITRTDGGVIGA